MSGLRAAAEFFDGESPVKRSVLVRISARAIWIEDENRRRIAAWPLDGLHRIAGSSDVRWRLAHDSTGEARLVIADPRFLAELDRAKPELKRPGRRRWLVPSLGGIAGAVLVGLLFVYGVPWVSRPLARALPLETRQQWGEAVVQDMSRKLGGFCTSAAGDAALRAMLARLLPDGAGSAVSLRVIDHEMTNAFAAPGGRIVLMRGLLTGAEGPDEVAGVLAHEIGHVLELHATAGAIRTLGFTALADMLMGDGSVVVDGLRNLGVMALVFAHSRDDEAAADRHAVRLLEKAQIDPRPFAGFFVKLQKHVERAIGGKTPDWLSYLSTHPPLEERAHIADTAVDSGWRPSLNKAQWRALRNICRQ